MNEELVAKILRCVYDEPTRKIALGLLSSGRSVRQLLRDTVKAAPKHEPWVAAGCAWMTDNEDRATEILGGILGMM